MEVPVSILQLFAALLQIYSLVLLGRIIVSWIPNVSRANPIVDLLYRLTDPVLEPVRQVIPPLGMIDLSPIVVFIGIHMLQAFLLNVANM